MQQHVVNARTFLVNKGLTAGEQVRVNIRTLANTAAIRREKRNGRDVIIVPSATMPDDVVMNDILYPAAEIAKSFKSLERTPAPLGHPTINGAFVSARDPESINLGWIGAWNENVRQEDGRVLLDKVIDVEVATCLKMEMLNGFLFGIDSSRIKDDEVRERVILYQREWPCLRVSRPLEGLFFKVSK